MPAMQPSASRIVARSKAPAQPMFTKPGYQAANLVKTAASPLVHRLSGDFYDELGFHIRVQSNNGLKLAHFAESLL